jgi:hypothetical protein
MKFQKKTIWIIVGSVLVISLLVVALLWKIFSAPRLLPPVPFTPAEGPSYYSFLDGKPVGSASEQRPRVISIMIDNHPGARPQSGLSQAQVVYEVPVEGEFTRYFAIFNASTTVDKVGPVRSARPYFLDWLQEYGDALYIHSGGSPEALQILRNSTLFDANEFFRGAYFWRGTDHLAPHNLYTSSTAWNKLLAEYGRNRPAHGAGGASEPGDWEGHGANGGIGRQ